MTTVKSKKVRAVSKKIVEEVLNDPEALAKTMEGLELMPKPTYHGAPASVDEAVQRILKLEMALEDLARAVEIVGITGQMEILDSFRATADDVLKDKIVIEQPKQGPVQITLVTDGENETAV